jgi:hypothetical protein
MLVDAHVHGCSTAPLTAAPLLPLRPANAAPASDQRVLHVCRPSPVTVTESPHLVDAESLASLANVSCTDIPVFTETTECFSHIIIWIDAEVFCSTLVCCWPPIGVAVVVVA